jgi:hypothetical protein
MPAGLNLNINQTVFKKSIDISNNALNKLRKDIYKELPSIFRVSGIKLVGKVADITPPMKGSVPDANLKHDVFNIFKDLKSLPFKQLVLTKQWKAVSLYDFNFDNQNLKNSYATGDYEAIYKAFSRNGETADGSIPLNVKAVESATSALHQSARKRINGGRGGWDRKTVYHVSRNYQESVNAVLEDAKKKIGSMIGGWAKCAKRLNGVLTNVPDSYASRGRGTIMFSGSPDKSLTLTIRNELGDFNGYLSQQKSGEVVAIMNTISNNCLDEIAKMLIKFGDKLK